MTRIREEEDICHTCIHTIFTDFPYKLSFVNVSAIQFVNLPKLLVFVDLIGIREKFKFHTTRPQQQ